MADKRYLKQRRQSWYFHIAVPVAVQPRLNGRKHITETLGTRDLTKAQHARWAKVSAWNATFEELRKKTSIGPEEIEGFAQRSYADYLEHLHQFYGDQDRPNERSDLAEMAAELADAGNALPAKVDHGVAQEIEQIAIRSGQDLVPGEPAYTALAHALTRARLHATLGRMAALEGSVYEAPHSFGVTIIDPRSLRPLSPVSTRRGSTSGMKFSEAAERFLTELQRDQDARKTAQTVAQHRSVYRLFEQFTGDVTLDDISQQKTAEFMDAVAKLHPDWGRSPQTKELTVWQLLERHGARDQQLSNRTLNRYLSSLRAVFKWARKRGAFKGLDPTAEQGFDNPAAKSTQYQLYTTLELQKLIDGPNPGSSPVAARIRPQKHDMASALYWLPLLALFTGARQGELCQLYTTDVECVEGIWSLRIHAEREGFRLKTEAAERRVPLHSTLVQCGFLEYVQALAEGQVFPALKRGGPDGKLNAYFTKRFTEYRRNVGVERRRVVFHSLRKNAAQALKNGGATTNDIAELIGHERGFTVETYAPEGLPVSVLKQKVELIDYANLDLSQRVLGP